MGAGLPIAVSLVAIAMGLNLLEALPLRLPSLDVDVRGLAAPPLLQVAPCLLSSYSLAQITPHAVPAHAHVRPGQQCLPCCIKLLHVAGCVLRLHG